MGIAPRWDSILAKIVISYSAIVDEECSTTDIYLWAISTSIHQQSTAVEYRRVVTIYGPFK